MALSNMQVFNEYFMPVIIETFGQQVEKFNAASNGAIVLTNANFDGDFNQSSFYSTLAAAQRRVNRNQANATVSSTTLQQVKDSSVKVAGGFGPVVYEPSQMTWLNKPTAEGIELASRSFAAILLKDQLNTAIAALVAAIGNNSSALVDVSATLGATYAGVNKAHAKFGDSSNQIVANIMNGAAYHNFIGQNLTNANNLFSSDGVMVVDILGRAVVVTDAPALYVSGTPNKTKILGLTPQAAVVSDGGDMIVNIDTTNGKERIETTFQADYTFGVGLKGYTWDETNGGKSPSDAALATGSNWDVNAGDVKYTAGVMLIADADK